MDSFRAAWTADELVFLIDPRPGLCRICRCDINLVGAVILMIVNKDLPK
jgi:hypothetical protein